jgi:hypothetical protein
MNTVNGEMVQYVLNFRLFFFKYFNIEVTTRVILQRVWIGGTMIYTESF